MRCIIKKGFTLIYKFINYLRIKLSDIVASYIATWKFIFIYTSALLLWIILHRLGILHIDTEDFIRYNLFLGYFASIQASIILMAANRQTEKDRKTIIKGVELDEKTLNLLINTNKLDQESHECMNKNAKMFEQKINLMTKKLNKIEEIISLMEQEEGIHD